MGFPTTQVFVGPYREYVYSEDLQKFLRDESTKRARRNFLDGRTYVGKYNKRLEQALLELDELAFEAGLTDFRAMFR